MSVRGLLARVARAFLIVSSGLAASGRLDAQTTDHGQHLPAPQKPADHTQHQPPSGSIIDLPHGREGSGTSWQPDASPMYAVHRQYGEWQFMGHGSAFLQYVHEGSYRGEDQFDSTNWVMGMASRSFGEGRLRLRGMLSMEPFTVNGCGYPNLLASGETCDGHAIVDKQHPHDLLMEVAAQYNRQLTSAVGVELYGGLAGEPALGPVAFPHRISAMPNPIAPVSHHWHDASHITFGVFTGGLYGRQWKVEGSLFNGREPDEDRYDVDFGALDSFSGRVWYLPNESLALQVSAGHLAEAEAESGELGRVDVDRVTASATYHRLFRDGSSIWASTLGWGRNTEQGQWTGFVLAETNVTFDEQDAWYGRLEIGRKSGHDLDIHRIVDAESVFTLSKAQAGYTRYFEPWNGFQPGVGAMLSLSLVPSALDSYYGNRASFGVGLYVTVRPSAMRGMPTARPARTTPPAPAAIDPHAGHTMPEAQQEPARPAGQPAMKSEKPGRMEKQMDPVNGLMVDPTTAPKTTYEGQTYYFSSEQTLKEFVENPARFAKKPKQ
jgi:YHS domain-containing protein